MRFHQIKKNSVYIKFLLVHVASNAFVDPALEEESSRISCTGDVVLGQKANGVQVCEVLSAGQAEVGAGSVACVASRS